MLRKRALSFMVILISILVITVGMYEVGQAQPKKGGTIIDAIGTEPTNLNPFKATREPEMWIVHLIFEPLFTIKPNLEIEPLLVESWKASGDHRTWTFVLKKGINFHDGTPLNAEAVKLSLEKHLTGSQGKTLRVIDSIGVVDENTVAIKLKESLHADYIPGPLLIA